MARILLAEDDASLRGFLTRALERAGHEVVDCENGDDAIDALDTGVRGGPEPEAVTREAFHRDIPEA